MFVLTELFSLGVTVEALRVTIDWKSTFLKEVRQFRPNFRVVGDVLRKPLFALFASECLTTLSLTVFTQNNFAADFLQMKCNFTRKTAVLRFQAPPWMA